MDAAVAAARAAYPGWSRATPGERSDALHAFAAVLGERAEELVQAESLQCGKPLKLSREFDVPGTVDNAAFFMRRRAPPARFLGGRVQRRPHVVRTPRADWCGRLHRPVELPAPDGRLEDPPGRRRGQHHRPQALRTHPFTSLLFAEAATAAGLPDGVVNIVSGAGLGAGEHLVGHEDVAMTSFTGSTAIGRRVAEIATAGVKRLHLELGGKAPFVVFDDADLDAAVHGAVAGALINSGQDCTAATRAYVQRPLYDAFVAGVADLMATVQVGDPFDPATDIGPLISHAHRDRVVSFVERAAATPASSPAAKPPAGAWPPGPTTARRSSPTPRRTARPSRPRSSAPSSSSCPSTATTKGCVSPTTPPTDSPPPPGPATSSA